MLGIRGREVGIVTAVADGVFAVSGPLGSFWLADDCIFTVVEDLITLQLNRDQVERCKVIP